MDNFSKHLASFPRRFARGYPVRHIGYVSRKTDWIIRPFDSCNYSFILEGTGEFRENDNVWKVEAPCVLTQWPGKLQVYGPDTTWEELYLIYAPEMKTRMERDGYLSPDRPMWRCDNPGALRAAIWELKTALTGFDAEDAENAVDRIDHLCERLILESVLGARRPNVGRAEKTIAACRDEIDRAPEKPVDVRVLARRAGMSPSTFRRYWRENVGASPGAYRVRAQVREACRLLAESDMTIGEIAARLEFNDPLYFSRRFRELTGMTATAYRLACGTTNKSSAAPPRANAR